MALRSAAGEAGLEGERGFDPRRDFERALVLAVTADDLRAERQSPGAEARGNRDRGHSGLRPKRTETRVAGIRESLGRLAGRGDRRDRIVALEDAVEPAPILVE